MIKYNQNAWLKPYIDMKTDLRKKTKNNFEEDLFFKLMIHSVTERRRNYVVSEPNYHTTKFLRKHLLAMEITKIRDTYE